MGNYKTPDGAARGMLTGQTAAGTGQTTALVLPGRGDWMVEVTTVGSGAGALLPPIVLPMRVEIANAGSNTLSIYPQSGGQIDANGTNGAATIAAGKAAIYEAVSLTQWYTVGATSAGATGTVTSASVATANGFAGTVATPTTTPAITISTTITGVLKGNGTAIAAATAGTDYYAPGTAIHSADLPNPSASTLGGVESYAAVSNQWINAISTSGVPSSAQPAFSNISGTAAAGQLPVFVASGGSHAAGAVPDPGASAGTTHFLREDATWAVPPTSAVTPGLVAAFAARNLIM
jgi:hypothetical protein